MEISIKTIHNDLLILRKEIEFIKNHMIDVDVILTADEEKRLDESLEDFRGGKTTSLNEFEEMNNVDS